MTAYVTEELELDQSTLDRLDEIAKENNATRDEVINEILTEYVSKKISIHDFEAILERNDHEEIAGYYTIIDDNSKPIARVIPAR